jgi:hypothetical protein
MKRITLIGERTRLACCFGAIAEKNRHHFVSETKPVMRPAAIQCPAKKRIALVSAFPFRSPSKAHPDSHAAKLNLAPC